MSLVSSLLKRLNESNMDAATLGGEAEVVLTKGQMGSETMLMLKVAMVDSCRWTSRLVGLNMRGSLRPGLKTLMGTSPQSNLPNMSRSEQINVLPK